MSDYKRLTDKEHRYKYCAKCTYRNCQYCDEKMYLDAKAFERLAELEDKIENGTLIELPDMRVIPDDVHGKLIQIVWFNSIGEIEWQYFNIKRKAEAEAKLEELKRGNV